MRFDAELPNLARWGRGRLFWVDHNPNQADGPLSPNFGALHAYLMPFDLKAIKFCMATHAELKDNRGQPGPGPNR